jgi:hypothetical protein
MVAASRLEVGRDTPWLAGRIGGWATVAWIARCTFFILAAAAAGLTAAIFSLIHTPGSLFVAGVALVAVAEWLIARRRLFHSGIEEALEVAGLLMVAVQLVDITGDLHGIGISLLVAGVFAAAGMRFLNPLFIALAAVALSFTIDFIRVRQAAALLPAAAVSSTTTMASVFCFAVAAMALTFGRVQLRRPSHDQMLDWLIVAMPLCGYLWGASQYGTGLSIESLRGLVLARLILVFMPLVFALAALIVGIRRRTHAPLAAFIVCMGCVAFELRNLTGLSLEARLIVWGSVTLVLSMALDRYLRTPRRGVTSQQVGERKGSASLLQLVGAAALTPQPAEGEAPFKGGGGAGGGGGASGEY